MWPHRGDVVLQLLASVIARRETMRDGSTTTRGGNPEHGDTYTVQHVRRGDIHGRSECWLHAAFEEDQAPGMAYRGPFLGLPLFTGDLRPNLARQNPPHQACERIGRRKSPPVGQHLA